MSKVESAIQWMENTAKDNRHGYDQKWRWNEKGDYDCSSAVITAWEQAGVPVKTKGATYTGNMLSVFKKCGFKDVTNQVSRSTGVGLLRGDVLLNTAKHTAMYCGNGMEVEASINEKGKAIGGVPGDQTGKEFLIRPYRNYPWNYVLRYSEKTAEAPKTASTSSSNGTLNKTIKRSGIVTASALSVRKWAGTDNDRLMSFPYVYRGDNIGICDEIKAKDGSLWYYVKITECKGLDVDKDIYGFVHSAYVK